MKAQAEGLTPAGIGSTVYTNFKRRGRGYDPVDNENLDIRVEFAKDRYDSMDKLQGMLLQTAYGTYVPLGGSGGDPL